MFPSDAFKIVPAFGMPGASEDILKKTEELLAKFQTERTVPVEAPAAEVPAAEVPAVVAPTAEVPAPAPAAEVPAVVAPTAEVPAPAPAAEVPAVVAPVAEVPVSAAEIPVPAAPLRIGLDLGTIHSLKVNSVKQSKSGRVYALNVEKDNGDYGYGLNYTKYPRIIKDNLMATASKKLNLGYFTPVIGVELGTAKHSDARHLAWNVNLGNETEIRSNLNFVSKMNYTNFGKKSHAYTSTYGLHYAF